MDCSLGTTVGNRIRQAITLSCDQSCMVVGKGDIVWSADIIKVIGSIAVISTDLTEHSSGLSFGLTHAGFLSRCRVE